MVIKWHLLTEILGSDPYYIFELFWEEVANLCNVGALGVAGAFYLINSNESWM